MKMTEIFQNLNRLIEQQHIMILAIITVLFLAMLIILLIKNKKVYCIETMLFIIPLLIIGFDFYARYIKGYTYHIEGNEALSLKIISSYIYALAFIIGFIVFIICLPQKKESRKNSDKSICGVYLDSNKKLSFNENFLNVLSFLGNEKNKWNKKCLEIYINEENVEYENIGEYIKNLDNRFSLRLKFPSEKDVLLLLEKKDTQNGYILKLLDSELCKVIKEQVSKEEASNKNSRAILTKSLESLNEPIGYYDFTTNKYHLTKVMQNKLNLDSRTISCEDFRNFIYFEDYVTYDSLCEQKDGSYKYRYRLKTCDGIEWYEEVRAFDGDEFISTFHKISYESNGVAIFNRDVLNKDLEQRIDKKQEFGLVFLYIEKAQSLIRKLGLDGSKIIIENYFNILKKNLLNNEDNIYKISNSEYCILFADLKDYYNVLDKVKKNDCELLKNDAYFEGNKYTITNTLGFVYTDELQEKNSLECIEAGLLSLYLAHNEESKYHIYSVLNVKNEDEEFETYKVDLDNTFLDKL